MPATDLPFPDVEPLHGAIDPPSVEDLKAAFAAAGLTVSVEERTLALTASADGGMLIGVFIGVPMLEFAKLMADDAYMGIKILLRRFVSRGAVHYAVYVSHKGVDAQIDSDLPPEAFLKLQGTLPNAPSGRIIYNLDEGRWQDSERSN